MTHDPTQPISLTLDWPPSVNHYWRSVGGRAILSRAGRQYRDSVAASVLTQGRPRLAGRLAVRLECRPPDSRRRDLDNVAKGILDGLAHAGVYQDDSQIDRLVIERCPVAAGGLVTVTLEEMRAHSGLG